MQSDGRYLPDCLSSAACALVRPGLAQMACTISSRLRLLLSVVQPYPVVKVVWLVHWPVSLIFAILDTMFNQIGMDAFLKQFLRGAIIILAVASYTYRYKGEVA